MQCKRAPISYSVVIVSGLARCITVQKIFEQKVNDQQNLTMKINTSSEFGQKLYFFFIIFTSSVSFQVILYRNPVQ